MSKRKPFPRKVWQATVDGVFYNRWFELPKGVVNGGVVEWCRSSGRKFMLYEGTIVWKEVELDGD